MRSRIASPHTQHFSKLFCISKWALLDQFFDYQDDLTYQVALLTIRFPVDSVEGFTLQTASADTAGEAGDVEDAIHGRAARTFTHHFKTALSAHSYSFSNKKMIRHFRNTNGEYYRKIPDRPHCPWTGPEG